MNEIELYNHNKSGKYVSRFYYKRGDIKHKHVKFNEIYLPSPISTNVKRYHI